MPKQPKLGPRPAVEIRRRCLATHVTGTANVLQGILDHNLKLYTKRELEEILTSKELALWKFARRALKQTIKGLHILEERLGNKPNYRD